MRVGARRGHIPSHARAGNEAQRHLCSPATSVGGSDDQDASHACAPPSAPSATCMRHATASARNLHSGSGTRTRPPPCAASAPRDLTTAHHGRVSRSCCFAKSAHAPWSWAFGTCMCTPGLLVRDRPCARCAMSHSSKRTCRCGRCTPQRPRRQTPEVPEDRHEAQNRSAGRRSSVPVHRVVFHNKTDYLRSSAWSGLLTPAAGKAILVQSSS